MAEMNIWLERFSRDIGYKSSVIVFGNTSDIILNPKNSGKYDKVINTLIAYVRDKGYKQIVKFYKKFRVLCLHQNPRLIALLYA